MLQVRREGIRLHPRLEGHGGVHGDPRHHGARPQPHHHRLRLHLHLLHDATTQKRRPHPRQGVRHRTRREPLQPQSHDELRAHPHLLAVLAALHLRAHVRVLGWPQV